VTRPAIEADNPAKTFEGGVDAVDGVSFAVRAGEIFGLRGPNGADKSTTVRAGPLLEGFSPQRPSR
jgi:ABC-type multidrug transport system ATPase subunit